MNNCFGNFKHICNLYDLPFTALSNSYRNDGALIYTNINKSTLSRLKNILMYNTFVGWYAIKSH